MHGASAATTGNGALAPAAPARAQSKSGWRGVSGARSGKYGARVGRWWLGTFATAAEAAGAYDAAAVTLYGAKAILNNFKVPAEAVHGDNAAPAGGPSGGEVEESPSGQKQEVPAAEAEARRKKKKQSKGKVGRKTAAAPEQDPKRFIGVRRRPSGRYSAQIHIHHKGRSKPYCWLGSFDTAEEAPREYDAAAINLRGPAVRINFEQHDGDAPAPLPVPSSDGVAPMSRSCQCPPSPIPAFDIANKPPSPALPVTAEGFFGEHGTTYGGVVDIHDEPIALDSSNILPVLPLDDLGISLSPAGWQQADDFLDFTDLDHLID